MAEWLAPTKHPGGQYSFCELRRKPLTTKEAYYWFEVAIADCKWSVLRGWPRLFATHFVSCMAMKGADQRFNRRCCRSPDGRDAQAISAPFPAQTTRSISRCVWRWGVGRGCGTVPTQRAGCSTPASSLVRRGAFRPDPTKDGTTPGSCILPSQRDLRMLCRVRPLAIEDGLGQARVMLEDVQTTDCASCVLDRAIRKSRWEGQNTRSRSGAVLVGSSRKAPLRTRLLSWSGAFPHAELGTVTASHGLLPIAKTQALNYFRLLFAAEKVPISLAASRPSVTYSTVDER